MHAFFSVDTACSVGSADNGFTVLRIDHTFLLAA